MLAEGRYRHEILNCLDRICYTSTSFGGAGKKVYARNRNWASVRYASVAGYSTRNRKPGWYIQPLQKNQHTGSIRPKQTWLQEYQKLVGFLGTHRFLKCSLRKNSHNLQKAANVRGRSEIKAKRPFCELG